VITRRVIPRAAQRIGRFTFAVALVAVALALPLQLFLATRGFDGIEVLGLSFGGGLLIAFLASRVATRIEFRRMRRSRGALEPRLAEAPAAVEAVEAVPAATLTESRETRASREIQTALLPSFVPSPAGYHLEVDYRPCGALGGDFYSFYERADGNLLFMVGDVSGKGPAGAIVMAMVQTLIRQNAERAVGPADLLNRVNDGFAGTLGKGIFATATAGLLEPDTHRLTLAGAGHHPALLLNPSRRWSGELEARGLALGLVAGERFADSLVENVVQLEPEDSLLVYTDGATECLADLTRNVGESRFLAAAAAALLPGPRGALGRLTADLWVGGGCRDDTTMLMVTRVGANTIGHRLGDRTSSEIKA